MTRDGCRTPSMHRPVADCAIRCEDCGLAAVVDGLYYSKDHEWVRVEGDSATVGITDFAQASSNTPPHERRWPRLQPWCGVSNSHHRILQEELGDLVYVELPEVGSSVEAGERFSVVESVKVRQGGAGRPPVPPVTVCQPHFCSRSGITAAVH